MNRTKVNKLLVKLGIPQSIKGFAYIADAMEVFDEISTDVSITKVVYPAIAKKHENATASRVERAIRHALEHTTAKAKSAELMKEITGIDKSKNFEALVGLYNYLKDEDEPTAAKYNGEYVSMPKEVIVQLCEVLDALKRVL